MVLFSTFGSVDVGFLLVWISWLSLFFMHMLESDMGVDSLIGYRLWHYWGLVLFSCSGLLLFFC